MDFLKMVLPAIGRFSGGEKDWQGGERSMMVAGVESEPDPAEA